MAADPAPDHELFSSRPPERTPVSPLPWIIAGVVILIVLAVLIIGHHKTPSPTVGLPRDPYADSIAIGSIEMSESTSLSGGKSTYIDGHFINNGKKTITGATIQVFFPNDEGLPRQLETVPLALIRTHEPYVDTEPVSVAPINPGDDREFRLIFEDISASWNGRVPDIRVVKVISH